MTWIEFWEQFSEPLTQLPLVGEVGPWFFLVAMALLVEWAADRFVVPWLADKGMNKLAGALTTQADGLRAGAIVASFSAATTLEKEATIIGLFVGAALPLVKLARDQLLTSGAVVLMLLLGGCQSVARSPDEEAQRQNCLLAAEGRMAARGEKECIEPGLGWHECPHREEIMSDLAEEQEKCR